MVPAIGAALDKVAALVGAEARNLTFIENASTGLNTVLKNMKLVSGDILRPTIDDPTNAVP